jgi:uncharacterized surface anchored protein
MRRSRVGRPVPRSAARPWRIACALAAAPAALALLVAAAPQASPSPTPSDTPTPTPLLQGMLRVVKTDLSGSPIVIPGAQFKVHQDSLNGNVVATLVTKNTGRDEVRLPTGKYCLEEVAAPPGFQVAPTYTPSSCGTVLLGQTTVISAADPPVAAPTPTPSATPTPTPTPVVTGELQITKVDPNNQVVTAPGFTFNVHVGSAKGQVIATIATDGSGTAIAGALNPATYCVEEVSAPDGWQVQPTYSPQSSCAAVASDPTQGRNPTTVTVTDPPAPTPTPSPEAAGAAPSASPSAHPNATGKPSTETALPVAALSKGLIGFGVLLLVAGAVMIALAVRRRRMRPPEPPAPADYWYDSTIS